jgi:hypothetical protein
MLQRKAMLLFTTPLALGALLLLPAAVQPTRAATAGDELRLEVARIYWEYNASAEDLGVHVKLDAEDWARMSIEGPGENVLFQVKGQGPYRELGMTELFFEGAEPALDDVPLDELLALFPAGEYEFSGRTVDGEELESEATFSHAIPDGPQVSTEQGANHLLRIHWTEVTAPPPGFPNETIQIAGYSRRARSRSSRDARPAFHPADPRRLRASRARAPCAPRAVDRPAPDRALAGVGSALGSRARVGASDETRSGRRARGSRAGASHAALPDSGRK